MRLFRAATNAQMNGTENVQGRNRERLGNADNSPLRIAQRLVSANSGAAQVVGDHAQIIGFDGAVRVISANGQHWDCQLALRDKFPIVDSVLGEGRELLERVVDGVRRCVELCVVVAGLLVDRRRIRRQFVVEAVEQNSFEFSFDPSIKGQTGRFAYRFVKP